MRNKQGYSLAPPLNVVAWLNCTKALTLPELKGKVVVIYAFQMLCPSCVTHSIPQANAIFELYKEQNVQVIGLHTVFEHHAVMTVDALRAFAYEYKIAFPIAVDKPSNRGPIPLTMAAYKMQGTPTLIILDRNGFLRLSHLGRISDIQIGDIIGRLLEENNRQ